MALKADGKYVEDLKPCVFHLLHLGLPPENCAEAMVTMAAFLGKTIVPEKAVQCENVAESEDVKN